MSQDAHELASDLFLLWEAGAVHLPTLALDYLAAAGNVEHASWDAQAAFGLPGTDGIAPSYEVWAELQGRLIGILSETGENLNATGEALLRVMNDYAEADGNNAAKLDLLEQINDRLTNKDGYDNPQPPGPPGPLTADPEGD